MLSTRIITAVLIAVPMLLLLFYLPPLLWQALIAMILVLTSWELLRLAGYSLQSPRAFVSLMLPATLIILSMLYLPEHWQWLLIYGACAGWLLVLIVLVHAQNSTQPAPWGRPARLFASMLFVLPAVIVFSTMQAVSPWLLLALLTIVWAADVFAYFTGTMIGGIKMASRISPNKTVSGLCGGLLGALLVASAWLWHLQLPQLLLLAALVIVLNSVVGDLLASQLKRQAQRKDSSSLLPGHGGLVDRLDSLMAAAPFYAVTVKLAVPSMLMTTN